jgi:hypothetical protein
MISKLELRVSRTRSQPGGRAQKRRKGCLNGFLESGNHPQSANALGHIQAGRRSRGQLAKCEIEACDASRKCRRRMQVLLGPRLSRFGRIYAPTTTETPPPQSQRAMHPKPFKLKDYKTRRRRHHA